MRPRGLCRPRHAPVRPGVVGARDDRARGGLRYLWSQWPDSTVVLPTGRAFDAIGVPAPRAAGRWSGWSA
ncbi:hypothetical protein ACU686_39095 [Yinghuangia aomiensis]